MKDEALSRAERISDARAAAALSNPMLRRLVLTFSRQPRSIGEISAQTGIELRRLHHHVTRLCRMGLLRIDCERPRRGRPVKLYRASAESYFIPYEVATELLTEPLSRELRGRIRSENLKSEDGVLLTTDEDGVPLMRPVSSEGAAKRAMEFWLILRLDPAEAKGLERDLKELLDRYAGRTTGHGKPYLVHAALAQRLAETVSVDNRRLRQLTR